MIGITGKSGSGKSTLADILSKKLDCISVDVDKIGHKATSDEEISKQLVEIFGSQILDNTGKINRKKLGNIVFSNQEKMDILTNLTWGYMEEKIDKIIKNETKPIILEWALLPISKFWEQCDTKIIMKADRKERKQKVILRDAITEEYFEKRDSKSLDYSNLKADFTFVNNYNEKTMEDFANQILTFY